MEGEGATLDNARARFNDDAFVSWLWFLRGLVVLPSTSAGGTAPSYREHGGPSNAELGSGQ